MPYAFEIATKAAAPAARTKPKTCAASSASAASTATTYRVKLAFKNQAYANAFKTLFT